MAGREKGDVVIDGVAYSGRESTRLTPIEVVRRTELSEDLWDVFMDAHYTVRDIREKIRRDAGLSEGEFAEYSNLDLLYGMRDELNARLEIALSEGD